MINVLPCIKINRNWQIVYQMNKYLITGNLKRGLYLRALCDGMEQAIQPFREDIIDLENVVLNDAHTPLTLILSRIQKYVCLFSVLNSIIREVSIHYEF